MGIVLILGMEHSHFEKSFLKKADLLRALDNSNYLSLNDTGVVLEGLGVPIVDHVFFKPSAPPFLIKGKTLAALGFASQREPEQYIVQEGDTLQSIADKFGISLETVLWANNLSRTSLIRPGQKLVILPVSGVLHIVRQGDTVSELAQLYQVSAQDIIDFNGLSEDGEIYAGDFLIIPGAKKPRASYYYSQVPLSGSYFICPIPSPCRITQGLHWFNAVDFSNGKCGDPVFAAANGTVQRVGYGNISGYYARIVHPNGVVTFYGHLSKAIVRPGQKVYQGQIIGYVGYSGFTIPQGPAGCHLHFDVRFAENPFARYPVGTVFGK